MIAIFSHRLPHFPQAKCPILKTAGFLHVPNISSTPHPGTDPYFLTIPSFSLFSALENNRRLLGISCLISLSRRSPPDTLDLPLALHPVILQREVVHLPYIDILPLLTLRHNVILFSDLIDYEISWFELTTSSDWKVMGSQSWDISTGFKERRTLFSFNNLSKQYE